ncbi:molybdopterin converting factor, large subunit [Pyrodictium delaneyi]|uniref:Molybdopterin converting factor, large subunit n=1 Tax=Pyrodictium delaneyi TaxID=1273541 RepID=A0A0P0N441_9CREN|nr:molybdenum cofactor biosynthesis protein MoaE [Pyrodictium delaneyi]ALL01436.1 molybdopterin converting factor, large subunit [Pyrodictium delaneyi]OWJ54648.1 hypothetical protein Pdsh_06410 [Pyrodictium delaneyi]
MAKECIVHIIGVKDGTVLDEQRIVEGASTAGELLERLGLGDATVYASGKRLEPGDTLPGGCQGVTVLAPPPGVLLAKVTGPGEKVDLDQLSRLMARRATVLGGGALVAFMGFVKGRVGGAQVTRLEYEALEPLATQKLRELAEKYARIPGVIDVAAIHYHGGLEPGDPTIYILVTAVTRNIAFHAAALLLEEIKHSVPIYKLERRSDGDYWILGDGTRIPRRAK